MKKPVFSLFVVTLFSIAANSQIIRGKVVDLVDNNPLSGARLTLVTIKDTTQKIDVIADKEGKFSFTNLAIDSFYFQVNFIGYEQFTQPVATTDSTPILELGTLFIPKKAVELGGIVVTSKAPPVAQKGDTTQYSASQFKVNPDATVEDLVKKMPGITVGRDGTVTAQGDQVRKVTIDGKDFFGDDATAALKNLPADLVDKIQVFDRLSEQSQFTGVDDGNSVKAINVVTKSGMKNGQFGRLYAGYGTEDRYNAGGNVSFFKNNRRISVVGNFNNINQQNFASQDLLGLTSSGGRGGGGFGGGGFGGGGFGGGGGNFNVGQSAGISRTNALGINFNDKWGKNLDVQGSYFFNNSTNVNESISRTQTPIGEETRFSDIISRSKTRNNNHRINMRLEYRIDSNNSIIIMPNVSFQNNRSESFSDERTYYGINDTANTALRNDRNLRDGYNIRNSVLWRHSFKSKRGRTLSVNLTTNFSKNDGESYNLAQFRFFDREFPGYYRDSLPDQYRINPTNGHTLSSNISYTEPIGARGQLQISYEPSVSKNKADQEAYLYSSIDGKYSEFVSSLSNKFENTTTTHNGGINYRLGASRDNQFSVGVNLQHSTLESDRIFPIVGNVNQTFTNLLPRLMWRRKISNRSSFNIFYRANTNFPSVTQLQDVVDPSNALRVSVGNPSLKQAYTHFVTGRYNFTNTQKGQSFFANVFLQTAQDYITNAIYITGQDSIVAGKEIDKGVELTKPINLNGYRNLRSSLVYSMPLNFIKSNINLSADFSYSRLPGLNNYKNTLTKNYVYGGGIDLTSNVSEYVDFNLSYKISFNDAEIIGGRGVAQDFVNQAAGLQFNLLSKNGWFLQNDLANSSYSGLSNTELDQSFWLWNLAIGKKFLKNRAGELKLSVFDLLKQNQSISRTVTAGGVIRDVQTQVLQQYFMLTFTYNLKNFGTPANNRGSGQGERRQWGGPGGGGRPGGPAMF